jgi:hypothetical protein
MKDYMINSSSTQCMISTNSDSIVSQFEGKKTNVKLRKVIPSGILENNYLGDASTSLTYIVGSEEKSGLHGSYPHITYYSVEPSDTDVLFLSEYLLERKRQENGIYSLHSSVIGNEENAVIFQGGSQSGKTILGFNTSYNTDLSFLYNERSLIDLEEAKLMGGCDLLRVSPYHRNLFPSLENVELYDLETQDTSRNIKGLVFHDIDSGISSPIIKRISPESANWRLYPEFSDRITGIPFRVNNFSESLPSLDDYTLSSRRIQSLVSFLESVPVYTIKGSLNSITEEAVNLIK